MANPNSNDQERYAKLLRENKNNPRTMHTTSSDEEYYTKVFYISLCLNGSVLHSNILFFVLKRAAKAMQNCP